jgi:hypothetical protein
MKKHTIPQAMKTPGFLRGYLLTIIVGLGLLTGASSASAVLVIHSGDIVDNAYTYELTADEMTTDTVFGNDVYERTLINLSDQNGVICRSVGTNSGTGITSYAIVPSKSVSGAYFTYMYDFTGAGYTIDSVQFTDRGAYISETTTTVDTTISIEWSTDNTNWTLLRSITSVDGAFVAPSNSSYSPVIFTEPVSTIYYRVTYTKEDGSNFDAGNGTEFGRTNDGMTTPSFSASFELTQVPEPSTCAIFGGGVALLVLLLRKRR